MDSPLDQLSTAPATVRRQTAQLTLYFGLLLTALSFGLPLGLNGLPVQFYLKNRLHASAETVALFQLLVGLPVCVDFLFGFVRDRWKPLGQGDRGYLLVFTPLAAMLGLWAATGPMTYARLLAALLGANFALRFVSAAVSALLAATARRRQMTGWMGAFWTVQASLLGTLIPLAGGWLGSRVRAAMALATAFTATLLALGFWRPASVFAEGSTDQNPQTVPRERGRQALFRLLRHRPLWPAALIALLWNFAPASQTPMLFYLTDTLKASNEAVGLFYAISALAFIPTSLLYVRLCRRYALWPLLLIATVIAVPQMLPLLWLHSSSQAMVAAALIGLLGGFANAAYFDLYLRSCPRGLEGTVMMIGSTVVFLTVRLGDLFGSWMYARGGFAACVVVTMAVYALIFPVLLLVPGGVMSHREGEPGREAAQDLLAEPEAS
jgi:MFS family permease